MDREIQEFVSTALNTSLSTYYRKSALNKLGRLKKSAELSAAIIGLLRDVEDESLQKEVMDLAVKFAVNNAVDLIIPIGSGNGKNARYALSILAKLGGKYSYAYLKSLADKPGFDLTKNAASRALHDLVSREPDLENEEPISETTPIVGPSSAKPVMEESKVNVMDHSASAQKVAELTQKLEEKDRQFKTVSDSLHTTQKELERLKNKFDQSKLDALEDENHQLRLEVSKVSAAFKAKISEMSLELSDLNDRLALGKKFNKDEQKSNGKGCLIFLFIVFLIFIFVIL